MTDSPILTPSEPSTVRETLFTRIFDIGCWILAQISWITWLLTSTVIEQGFWTLPMGLLYIPLQCLSLLGCIGLLCRRRWTILPWLILNFFCIQKDIALTLFNDKKETDIAVMTWNIEGKTTLTKTSTCVVDFINDWKEESTRQILIVQEVPQNKVRSLEQKLGLSCSFQTYEPNWTLGSMVCSDKAWSVKRFKQRPLDNNGYRYLFAELTDKESKQKMNILNIHLQSLAKVAMEDNVPRSNDIVTSMRLALAHPRKYLGILTDQNIEHKESILKIGSTQTALKDPSIIAGDFNTPPQVPIHKMMRALHLTDAHLEKGNGWGFTIAKFGLIFSRIDFLYATEQLDWAGRTQTHTDITCSDHYPVTTWLNSDFLQ